MKDKVYQGLIYKADNDFRDYINEREERPIFNGSALPLDHLIPYRLPVKVRTYFGRCTGALTVLINRIIEVHTLLVSDGLTDPLQYRWHGQHYYEMQEIKECFSEFMVDFEKLCFKKKRAAPSAPSAMQEFDVNFFEPISRAFEFTQCILHDVIREMYTYFTIYQFGTPLPHNFPFEMLNDFRIKDVSEISYPLCSVLAQDESKKTKLSIDERKKIIDDIYELRQYFFKGWDASKHRFEHGRYRIQIELQSPTPELLILPFDNLTYSRYECIDNIIINDQTYKSTLGGSPYLFNGIFDDVLLKKAHDYLIEFFLDTKIGNQKECSNVAENIPEYIFKREHYHDSVATSNELEPDKLEICLREPGSSYQIFSTMKLSKFRSLMEREFSCDFQSGKGSEMKIQREGTRIMTIGCHKQDFELAPYKIKQILKRVEVSVEDFIVAFNKN